MIGQHEWFGEKDLIYELSFCCAHVNITCTKNIKNESWMMRSWDANEPICFDGRSIRRRWSLGGRSYDGGRKQHSGMKWSSVLRQHITSLQAWVKHLDSKGQRSATRSVSCNTPTHTRLDACLDVLEPLSTYTNLRHVWSDCDCITSRCIKPSCTRMLWTRNKHWIIRSFSAVGLILESQE